MIGKSRSLSPSFPESLFHHLSNSNGNIFTMVLGCRFHEGKYKTFHKMLGECEVLCLLVPPPPHWSTHFLKQEPFIFILNPQDLARHMQSACLLNEWMDTWSNKMNKPISTLLNWYSTYDVQKLPLFCRNWISVLTVGCPWPNLLVISILLSLD